MTKTIVPTKKLYHLFMSKIAHAGTGCWEWEASKTGGNYGTMKIDGRTYRATHVALTLAGKPRPDGMIALHSCDNPPCVNPKHLRWGTYRDNAMDAVERGRHRVSGNFKPQSGELHHAAKLTEEKVRYIRNSPLGYKALARELGVNRTNIRMIKRGETWKHVT